MEKDFNIIELSDNSSTYKKNLEALKKVYPRYYDKVISQKDSKKYVLVKYGQSNALNIYDIEKNQFYYDINDPLGDAKKQVDDLKIKNGRIIQFLGFGLGYMADYFTSLYTSQNNVRGIIIVERDVDLFRLALKTKDFTPMINNSRIKLILDLNEHEFFTEMENYIRVNGDLIYFIKCIKNIYHTSALAWFGDYYKEIVSKLTDVLKYMLTYYGNDPDDSLIGIENMLDNMKVIIENPGINLLFNKFKGKPAIIVSTGPSLNKNKHLLKGLENKALFICPDASLRILTDMGVKPHMVTALERVELTTKLVQGFTDEEVEDVYYAACPVVHNDAYKFYNGPKIIVYRKFDHFKWIEIDRGTLNIKQSAGNMAFKIADALGCDPIILVGQDLSYSRDGKTHAKGTPLGENQVFAGREDFEVMGNDGEMIMTHDTWNNFRLSYEVDIAESNSKCINSTEGGALIRGAEILSLNEAINRYIKEEFNPLDIIKKELSQFSTETSENDYNRFKEIITKTIEDLKYMQEQCIQGFANIEYLLGLDDNSEEIESKYEEIISYKKAILNLQPTMQLFLMHVVQSYNIKFEIDANAIFNSDDDIKIIYKRVAEANKRWFGVFHNIIKICIELLIKTELKLGYIDEVEDDGAK